MKKVFLGLLLIVVSFWQSPNNQKTDDTDRIELCKKNYTALFGGEALNGEGTDPEIMDILQKYIFGEVFRTGDLDIKTREMITCVCLATMQQLPQLKGHAEPQLHAHLHANRRSQ